MHGRALLPISCLAIVVMAMQALGLPSLNIEVEEASIWERGIDGMQTQRILHTCIQNSHVVPAKQEDETCSSDCECITAFCSRQGLNGRGRCKPLFLEDERFEAGADDAGVIKRDLEARTSSAARKGGINYCSPSANNTGNTTSTHPSKNNGTSNSTSPMIPTSPIVNGTGNTTLPTPPKSNNSTGNITVPYVPSNPINGTGNITIPFIPSNPNNGTGNTTTGVIPPSGSGNITDGSTPPIGFGNITDGSTPPIGFGNITDGSTPPIGSINGTANNTGDNSPPITNLPPLPSGDIGFNVRKRSCVPLPSNSTSNSTHPYKPRFQ